eukprot:1582054-Alexandrium_andersonii.AAC.1
MGAASPTTIGCAIGKDGAIAHESSRDSLQLSSARLLEFNAGGMALSHARYTQLPDVKAIKAMVMR